LGGWLEIIFIIIIISIALKLLFFNKMY